MSYCHSCHHSPCTCYSYVPTCNYGCPFQLDFSCVIYHKDNNEVTELDGLGLSNGVTLEAAMEALDEKVKANLNVTSWTLSYLRTKYTINTLQQFGQAVDAEFAEIDANGAGGTVVNNSVGAYLGELVYDPTAINGQYWYNTTSNQLKIRVNGITKIITTS